MWRKTITRPSIRLRRPTSGEEDRPSCSPTTSPSPVRQPSPPLRRRAASRHPTIRRLVRHWRPGLNRHISGCLKARAVGQADQQPRATFPSLSVGHGPQPVHQWPRRLHPAVIFHPLWWAARVVIKKPCMDCRSSSWQTQSAGHDCQGRRDLSGGAGRSHFYDCSRRRPDFWV